MKNLIVLGFMFFIMFLKFFLLSMLMFYYKFIIMFDWSIFIINSVDFSFIIYIDWKSMFFISIVSFISFCVFIYSFEYMNGEDLIDRFVLLLLLFVLSMYFLILCPSLIGILLGWDGLGLISFCLVIFYQNLMSYNKGLITFISNRVGDVGLIISISLSFMFVCDWTLFNYLNLNDFIIWFILLASITKSAQIPFSSWLPAAMAAPTPVSSLVHSSTLVTAGIYLLIRYGEMMNMYSSMLLFILSLLTSLMAGFSALCEYDLKKIVALSTLSQLGLMMMMVSLNNYMLAFYHLMTHALFKSLLFLCAGKFIHFSMCNQDIRKFGGLFFFFPITSIMFLISILSLCGFPFFSGFYSKDLILEYVFINLSDMKMYMLMLSVLFTFMYSFRLILYMLCGELSNFVSVYMYSENMIMLFPMILLSLMSMISGSIFNWMFFYNLPVYQVDYFVKFMMILMFLIGLFLGWYVYFIDLMIMGGFFYNFMFFSLMFLDLMIVNLNKNLLMFSNYLYIGIENGWVENMIGKNLLERLVFYMKFIKYDFNIFYLLIFFFMLMFMNFFI
uniref:NADH-ubiquinone oxidoreductase chain 5 n=2 Tax=Ammophila sabulosa TaxID=1088610 RepID=A0A7L7S762_9HYME|nr:NADH dehydrogenase subunit 5 [Ammophila sabulosa]